MSSVNGVPVADRSEAVRELLRQRALELALIDDTADEAALAQGIETLLEREVRTPDPSLEECRRYYDQRPAEFTAGELVFARHILFAVTPGVPVALLRQKAERTLAELRQDPEQFAARAKGLSNCPSGQLGGDLGQLSRGECAPEFEAELFGTGATGLLPRLIRTRYGLHIVAIDGRVAGRLLPFEAVQERIAVHLVGEVQRKALAQYVAVLAGKARLDGVDLAAAGSPLVQ
jgi:peptidyl-prolyl cis-trans isomerase C